ncbi:MAG: hypothetical protein JW973_00730 [Bacteroidales bacterium]|nr:hypothetical protein [Bacteroidales bacterium]
MKGKRKRIEIYDSFEESEKAMLAIYAEYTPEQCWLKGHELSERLRHHLPEEEPGVFSMHLKK